MYAFLREQKVKVYNSATSTHAPFVERFNYTIQTLISKFMCQNDTYSFYESFDKIVQNYNMKIHSALGISPEMAEKPEFQMHVSLMHELKYRKFQKKTARYKPGQLCRVSVSKGKFSPRGYAPQFTNEVFYISKVFSHLPRPLYLLKSADKKDTIIGKFYAEEIFPIRESARI